MRIGIVRVIHLVADRPEEDRRVVPVAAHHVRHVAFDPHLEEVITAVETGRADVPPLDPLALGELPLVRSLIHDQQPQFVAQVVDHRSLRIVAHADGVHTDSAQVLQTPAPHFGRDSRTQHPGIVMQADPFDLHPAAVQGKPPVGIECQRAEAGTEAAPVDPLTVAQQIGLQRIEVRIVEIPPVGIVQPETKRSAEAVRIARHDTLPGRSHLHTVRVTERYGHLQPVGRGHVPLQRIIHSQKGPAIGQRLHTTGGPPLREVDLGSRHDPDVAVDARTGIPPRIGITAVIHPHGQHIVARLQVGGHVVEERNVAIGAAAEQMSVQIDLTAVVNPFEIDVVACGGVRHGKVLAVPGDPAGQVTRAAGQRRRQRRLDRPVVRQRQTAPAAVVESRHAGRRIVTQAEKPVIHTFFGSSERDLCPHRNCTGEKGEKAGCQQPAQKPSVLHCKAFVFHVFFGRSGTARAIR